MASTYTVQNTVDFVSGFVKLRPLSGIGGVANEPALTIANTVLQTILGPPFVWRWNRKSFPFAAALAAGTQDYPETIGDFGFLEKSYLSSASGDSMELVTKLILSVDSAQGRPNYIAPQLDNGAGQITFRLLPVPDAAYTVTLAYQSKAALFTALTDTWMPIPDEFGYIYNMGFMAFAMMYANDMRFPWAMQRFLGSLLGASEGVSEQEKALFLGNWIPVMQAMDRGPMLTQMGAQTRMGA